MLKCQKVLKMGSIIFPEKDIWEYEMLGPLTWIEIPENELKEMLRKYRELMEEEKIPEKVLKKVKFLIYGINIIKMIRTINEMLFQLD